MDEQPQSLLRDWEVRLHGEKPERLTIKGAAMELDADGNLTFMRDGVTVTVVARGAWVYMGTGLKRENC